MSLEVHACDINFPSARMCSGHGYCDVNSLRCICDSPSWTDVGDFRTESGLDCDIYGPAILALCIIGAIIGSFTSTFCIYLLYYRQWRHNWLLGFCAVFITLITVSDTFYSFYKIINMERVAGIDIFLTIPWCVTPLCFAYASLAFVDNMIRSYLRKIPSAFMIDKRGTHKQIIKISPAFRDGSYVIASLPAVSPLLVLAYPEKATALLAFFYVGCGIYSFLMGLSVRTAIIIIRNSLKTSVQMEGASSKFLHGSFKTVEDVVKDLNAFYGYLFPMMCIFPFGQCIFGLWPFFRLKSTYHFLIASIINKPLIFTCMILISPHFKPPGLLARVVPLVPSLTPLGGISAELVQTSDGVDREIGAIINSDPNINELRPPEQSINPPLGIVCGLSRPEVLPVASSWVDAIFASSKAKTSTSPIFFQASSFSAAYNILPFSRPKDNKLMINTGGH